MGGGSGLLGSGVPGGGGGLGGPGDGGLGVVRGLGMAVAGVVAIHGL